MQRIRARRWVVVLTVLCVLAGLGGPARPAAAAGPPWWDANYGARLGMSLFTGSATASGYSLNVTLDHAAAVAAGASLASGDDVRVVRWNGSSWTELDRVLDPASSWNSSTTKLWFRSPVALGSSTLDTSFYLYYGYAGAGSPPANGSNVFDLWDDFSGGGLDASKWTVDSGGITAAQTGGELKIAGTTGMLGGGATSVSSFGPDVMIEASVRIVSQSVSAHDNYQMCVTVSYWDCVYSNNAPTKRVQWNNYGPWNDLGSSSLQAQTFGYHRLGVIITSGGTVTEVEDGTKQYARSTSTAATQVDLNYHPFVSATVDVRFDNVYVRKYVTTEPTIVLDKMAFTTLNATVDPTLQFTVGPHAGACNGVAQTSGSLVTGSMVRLAPVNAGADAVAAQDLTVSTNAASGFAVVLRSPTGPTNATGHVLSPVGGTNASPGAFPTAGTEAFGYTTDDSALATGGTSARFTAPSAKWAALSTADAPVSYSSGPAAKTTCVAFQAGVSSSTPAGTYSATVLYNAVPIF